MRKLRAPFALEEEETGKLLPHVSSNRKRSCADTKDPWFAPLLIFFIVFVVTIVFVFGKMSAVDHHDLLLESEVLLAAQREDSVRCASIDQHCRLQIVESIPEGLEYPKDAPTCPSTFSVWMDLIATAKESIQIASFYWTLQGKDVDVVDATTRQGETILDSLKKKGSIVTIVQSLPNQQYNMSTDILQLQRAGASVRDLDMPQFFGGGVLHTKLWIVDGRHGYVGSANMDFRSLTQVKELGVWIQNCTCLMEDLEKIFEVYWMMAASSRFPSKWPKNLYTHYNEFTPLKVGASEIFASSAPPEFNPPERTNDLDAILKAIGEASEFVYVAVMDYFPESLYKERNIFWPPIDDALRRAATERRVDVRLLASHWNHTRPSLKGFLCSLSALGSGSIPGVRLEARSFVVPVTNPSQARIPFSRVNHNKYMVTERVAFVGTSNWCEDYFANTAGVGLTVAGSGAESVQQKLRDIFLRDWGSQYSSAPACT